MEIITLVTHTPFEQLGDVLKIRGDSTVETPPFCRSYHKGFTLLGVPTHTPPTTYTPTTIPCPSRSSYCCLFQFVSYVLHKVPFVNLNCSSSSPSSDPSYRIPGLRSSLDTRGTNFPRRPCQDTRPDVVVVAYMLHSWRWILPDKGSESMDP